MHEQKMKVWEEQLRNLLGQLQKGSIALIEFGQPRQQLSDVFTRIRIRLLSGHFAVHFVHVFYGEHTPKREGDELAALYPLGNEGPLEKLVQDVMAEVDHWTQARAEVGKNYTCDINEGLEFAGFALDPHAPKADI